MVGEARHGWGVTRGERVDCEPRLAIGQRGTIMRYLTLTYRPTQGFYGRDNQRVFYVGDERLSTGFGGWQVIADYPAHDGNRILRDIAFLVNTMGAIPASRLQIVKAYGNPNTIRLMVEGNQWLGQASVLWGMLQAKT